MAQEPPAPLRVEVVFALAHRQEVVALTVPPGCTAAEAVARSGLAEAFPEHGVTNAPLGVFGHRVPPDFVLADGDRVEIYRPLTADPKTSRRRRAAEGRTMSGREQTTGRRRR